jgi:hypothetical protein
MPSSRPGRQREAQAMAWAARDQRQPLAVVDQLLVAGDAPERESLGIGRRIGIRVELHHGRMAGQPGRMRVPRIQGRVFQQAQAPAMRRIGAARTAQPVEPVIGMPAQVLPGQREGIQTQDVEVSGGGIPVREMMRIDHDASSCRRSGTSPRAFNTGLSQIDQLPSESGRAVTLVSRPIGSGALRNSSECDDRAIPKRHAAQNTVPQPA